MALNFGRRKSAEALAKGSPQDTIKAYQKASADMNLRVVTLGLPERVIEEARVKAHEITRQSEEKNRALQQVSNAVPRIVDHIYNKVAALTVDLLGLRRNPDALNKPSPRALEIAVEPTLGSAAAEARVIFATNKTLTNSTAATTPQQPLSLEQQQKQILAQQVEQERKLDQKQEQKQNLDQSQNSGQSQSPNQNTI